MIEYKYDIKDKICGEAIIGQAGTIREVKHSKKGKARAKKVVFRKSAVCVVSLPITINNRVSSTKTKNHIEGLRGEKIVGEARNCSRVIKVKKTGAHTQQQMTLKDNAKCVIDIPITSQK